MWDSINYPHFTQPSHSDICDNIIRTIAEQYCAELPADQDLLDGVTLAAALAPLAGISSTEYLRLAIAAMKRAGRRDLAQEIHFYYLEVLRNDD